MKNFIKGLALLFLLQSSTCENQEPSEDISRRTSPELTQKKQEILDYIAGFSCNNNSSCSSIAFGSKPCGGPWEYLVFPSTVNLQTLQSMVTEYNEMENQFNVENGVVSDCMLVMPPENFDCDNGKCVVIN
jgi:hypothetical protein